MNCLNLGYELIFKIILDLQDQLLMKTLLLSIASFINTDLLKFERF